MHSQKIWNIALCLEDIDLIPKTFTSIDNMVISDLYKSKESYKCGIKPIFGPKSESIWQNRDLDLYAVEWKVKKQQPTIFGNNFGSKRGVKIDF